MFREFEHHLQNKYGFCLLAKHGILIKTTMIVLFKRITLKKTKKNFSLYFVNWAIGLASRVFANGPGDHGSIPG